MTRSLRVDLSARDDLANIVVVAPTRRRRSLSAELAASYWLDAHGPAIAALPGLSVYYQHHLRHDHGDLWPQVEAVATGLPDEQQLDGLAEFGFADDDGAAVFGAAATEANVMADEQNVFDMVIVQPSGAGANRTFLDTLEDPIPNGPLPYLKLMLGLRKAPGANAGALRDFVFERLAPGLVESDLVLKVRASLVDDFLPEHWDSPNVRHDVPVPEQYQAYVELVVKHRLDLARLYASPEFGRAVYGMGDVVRQVNAFPVHATHCFVFRGERTLVGVVGAHRARTITDAGSLHLWPEGVLA